MDKDDQKFFLRRDRLSAHNSKQNSSFKDNSIIIELIKKVYCHQVAAFEEEFIEDLSTTKYFAKLFYEKHYKKGNNFLFKGKSEQGNSCTINDLVNTLTKKSDECITTFLLGSVGSGKTALVNYLISEKFRTLVDNKNYWFVRFDVELNFDQWEKNDIDPLKEVFEKFANKVDSVLKRKGEELFQEFNSIKNKITKRKENTNIFDYVGDLILTCKPQRRAIIIFDNIDSVVHRYQSGLFEKDSDENIDKARVFFRKLLKKFRNDGNSSLDKSGASVLFVLRNTTYDWLTSYPRHHLGSHDNIYFSNDECYTLIPKQWHEVIDSRNGLFRDCIKLLKNEDIQKIANGIVNHIDNDLKVNRNNIKHALRSIETLTNSELRSLVDFLGNYVWINSNGNALTRNIFFESKAISQIAYIIGGNKLFSERYSGFPNVFTISYNKPKKALPHSYWLNLLILQTLKGLEGEYVSDQQIVNFFEDYDELLVKECLNNLSHPTKANLISVFPEFEDGITIDKSIKLTKRGKYCINHIFNKFSYVQLVVDDYNLLIPLSFKEKNQNKSKLQNQSRLSWSKPDWVLDKKTIDYTYIIEPSESESRVYEKMLEKKTKQVLTFLDILKGALRAEKEIYPKSFDNLNSRGIVIPPIGNIKKTIKDEIIKIHNSVNRYRENTKLNLKELIQKNAKSSKSISDEVYLQFKEAASSRQSNRKKS